MIDNLPKTSVSSTSLIPCNCKGCGAPLMRRPSCAPRAKCPTCLAAALQARQKDPKRNAAQEINRARRKAENPEKYRLQKQKDEKNYRLRRRERIPLLTSEQLTAQRRINIQKAHTPEARAKMSKHMRTTQRWKKTLPALIAASKTPENQQKRIEGIRSSEKAKKAARETSKKYIGLAWAAYAQSPICQKDEKNVHAKRWRIRSPRNVVYEFTNLSHFIRNHPELFEADDIAWRTYGNSVQTCRAISGISALRPGSRKMSGSWKGWQWVGYLEHDLLGNNNLLSGQVPDPK